MINIKIPNNNIPERKYILDIIFEEFLGLKYELKINNGKLKINDWIIELENGKYLIIKDNFFNKYPKDLEYLKLENIPNKIEELDIFSASFFMLTRWEEYVNKNRDSHNRFPATESLAYKQSFLDRPIVNEYVEWLKEELLKLDSSLVFKKREFELVLTHDVDMTLLYRSFKSFAKQAGGDIVKRKSFLLFMKTLQEAIYVKLNKTKDPYDTFDWLMDVSEKVGVKSYFFFMAKGKTKFDNKYKSSDTFVKDLVAKIKQREHYIGIHPTYNAYNDFKQLKKEKKELEKNLDINITFGREHYLKFEVPTTWQIWEDNGMEWDSTCGYADKEGFRCGVCYEYSVFNILNRKKLKLKEKPLVVMETTFLTYQHNFNNLKISSNIKSLLKKVKNHNGTFVFLWHNSNLNKKNKKIYLNVIKEV